MVPEGELVASIRSRPSLYSARVIDTVPVEEEALTVSVADLVTPFADAVTSAVRVVVPEVVETVKVALDAPAATVTDAGTVAAAVLLLASATTSPPEGAAAVSDTVPVEDWPPVTVDGDSEMALSEADGVVVVCVIRSVASRDELIVPIPIETSASRP